jgi:hypothetical protein
VRFRLEASAPEIDTSAQAATFVAMPRRRSPQKMFKVVVLTGVSLTACSSGVALPADDAGPAPGNTVVTNNPPAPVQDSGADAADARGDAMPIIK